ncbi:MAG: ribulose-phosphate 3-epimerase [Bacteroidales bacterium]|jgi:ribulose-phosphate 3-epimerase|nr:ribulose-phosphate 3-epimerase [Bacteroidales bacterium]MCI1733322.1 ribulose-phosphate 3-epimerase [Bacteroidales bacterium]
MSVLIAPSMLSADFGNLNKDIELVNKCGDIFHLDIMDGVFVPNISYGTPVIKAITKRAQRPVEAHLMIVEPQKFFKDYKNFGIGSISVHYEACVHLNRTIQQIKELGMKAGVAINPGTSVYLLEDIICDLDYVLLMSVNPGFGGQSYIPESTEKIARLKKFLKEHNPKCLIEVDGGVNMQNVNEIKTAGADILVAGSAVFNSKNPEQTIQDLRG